MSGNARFHDKQHRKNHHTNSTTGFVDSASDPIASHEEPFQGDFVLNGSLSVNQTSYLSSIITTGNLSCNSLYTNDAIYTNYLSGEGIELIISDRLVGGSGDNTATINYLSGFYVKTSKSVFVVDIFLLNGSLSTNSYIIAPNVTIIQNLTSSWNSVYSSMTGNSGYYDQSYTALTSTSGKWNSVYSSMTGNSGYYDQSYTALTATSGKWNSVYSSMTGNSGYYDQSYTALTSTSGKWNSVYNSMTGSSGFYDQAYNLLSSGGTVSGALTVRGNISSNGILYSNIANSLTTKNSQTIYVPVSTYNVDSTITIFVTSTTYQFVSNVSANVVLSLPDVNIDNNGLTFVIKNESIDYPTNYIDVKTSSNTSIYQVSGGKYSQFIYSSPNWHYLA